MTDKQIIIDGVDVSGCEYWKGYCRIASLCDFTGHLCEVTPNCYYKQLLRKEQECEELKKIIDEAKNSKLDLKSFLVGEAVQNEYEQQLDQLKAENEELTTINARLLGRLEVDETDTSLVFNLDKELRQKEKEFYIAIQKVVKLKQTLAEIKEIAEACIKQDICTTCDNSNKCHIEDEEIPTYDVCKLILQKINEVDNELQNRSLRKDT